MSPRGSGKTLRWLDLERELAAGEPAPVYALCGPELLLADEAVAAIGERILGGEWGRMNRDVFRAPETGPAAVVQAAQQVPLFSERRLVLYEQWENAGRAPEREKRAWLEYLASPSPSTCLVVRSSLLPRELQRKGRFFRDSLARMVTVELWHPFPREAVGWLQRRAKALGMTLPAETARFLVDHLGTDLLVLKNELEKISLFTRDHEGPITPEDLRDWGRRGLQVSAWRCVEALVGGRTREALRGLPAAREEDRPTGLVWKIQYQAARATGQGEVGWGTRLLRDCYHWERDLKRGRWPGALEGVALEVLFLRAHRSRLRRA
jgi:DNA polymerase-3 subunit delta